MKSFKRQSERKQIQLEQQLEVMKNDYESQITEHKRVCDHRIAVLDKRFAEKEQVHDTIYSL